MSNNKQSSVEWLVNEHFGGIENCTPDFRAKIAEAKAMHKDEIIKAINEVSENNVKYANMIISSWSPIEGALFRHNTKVAEQYYNETFESNDGKALDN